MKIGVPPDWVVRLLRFYGSIKGNQHPNRGVLPLISADSVSSFPLVGICLVNSDGELVRQETPINL